MALRFDPISGTGTHDVAVSLANALESGELVTDPPTVSTSDAALLVASAPGINAAAIDQDGVTAAIGEAAVFTLTGQVATTNKTVQVYLTYVGTAGSSGTYTIEQPIVPRISI